KIVAASWQAKNNAARTLVMPVIKENTLTEGNNNHWNLVLPAWQYSSDKAEQEKLNTWRVRLALEDENGNFMVRKHTIDVPPGTKRSYRVTADALGRWAYHCHLLYHMEMGMFREVRVEE
ncbi:multicopper oxidase domain-containing protein, partial [Escherichia coli]|nr:multicopper oxidase domain-containing protein [Escherichia coli]